MNTVEMSELLLKIYDEQKEIRRQLGIIPEMQEQLKGLPAMQEQLKVLPKMQEQIKELQKEVRKISRTVAKIEVEHGEKLQALFDAYTMQSQKLETHDKRINFCERKIEKHDDKLYYLDTKVQGL